MEFAQDGITTLHDFGDPVPSVDLGRVAVVVPLTTNDVGSEAVRSTFSTLAGLDPSDVVIPLRGGIETVQSVETLLDAVGLRATVLWCDAPTLAETLTAAGLPTDAGKGLDVWLGLACGAERADIVVVHDADALTYDTHHVPRLAWPISQGYRFSKGYYARIDGDRLWGRLVRLLWTPLLETISRSNPAPIVEYLSSFRYPLAGEMAVPAETATQLRLTPGWGLEVSILGEMFARAGRGGTAQVDLGTHDHDHRPIDGDEGLVGMAAAVTGTLDEVLRSHGVEIEFSDMRDEYEQTAATYIDQYAADAAFNGFRFDRQKEHSQVATYRSVLRDDLDPSIKLPAFSETALTATRIRNTARTRPRREV